MKKYLPFLVFLFSLFLIPFNTYAKTDVSPYWSGYKNRSNDWSRPHNISSGFDSGLSDCNGLARWQGCSIPAADTNLRQFYAITSADVCFSNSVVANKVYNIELQWWGSYGNYSTDANWYVGFNEYSWSPNGAITHTGHDFSRNNDNHYRGTTTYTFVPNNNYNSWCISIGGGDFNDRVLWLNRANESNGILLAYAYLDEISGTDTGAMLEQQIQTNNKLNDINNNQKETNNKIDETNDKLDSVNDNLTNDNMDNNMGDSLFGDFDFYEDNTLSGVITAPFRFINRLTDNCSPITLRAFNKDISIQCGTTLFWNRSDVSSFKTFWNILFGGLIIYRLVLKLFKVVNDVLDPQKDSVEGVDV